jgi:hypothetical protein
LSSNSSDCFRLVLIVNCQLLTRIAATESDSLCVRMNC